MDAEFYNKDFKKFGGAYSRGHYARRNEEIATRLKDFKIKRVFEAACVEGNLALNILKRKPEIEKYICSDFSEEALRLAEENLIWFQDKVDLVYLNAENDKAISKYDFDTFVCTCLEHIHNDLNVIKSLKKGTLVVLSLPNFMYKGHVRCFRSKTEVRERYEGLLDIQTLWEQHIEYSRLNIFFNIRKFLFNHRYSKLLQLISGLFGLEIYGIKKKFNLIAKKL